MARHNHPALVAGMAMFTAVSVFGGGSAAALAQPAPPSTAPAFTSAATITFTVGTFASFTVSATGNPTPTITGYGSLPIGLTFDPSTGIISGTPVLTTGSQYLYSLTFDATNAVAPDAVQNFTFFLDQPPQFGTGGLPILTAGYPVGYPVEALGWPKAVLTESGQLPPGISFGLIYTSVESDYGMVSGTPAAGSEGNYPVTFSATNGIGPPVQLTFTFVVQKGGFVYPSDGQLNVDTTLPFTWLSPMVAVAVRVTIGIPGSPHLLFDSGNLSPNSAPAGQYTIPPVLPPGVTLYASLAIEVGGSWSTYQTISFTAQPGAATFAFPTNGQLNALNNQPFAWSGIHGASNYDLIVGTHPNGRDVFDSGVLPPTQTSYLPARALPAGVVLCAGLTTIVGPLWTRVQAIVFTAAPGAATFVYPTDGQQQVDTTVPFTWSPVPQAQGYIMVVGTRLYASDLAFSGILPATTSSYVLPLAPPVGSNVYATLFTEVGGTWTRYASVIFTARVGVASMTMPADGATGVSTVAYMGCCSWTYVTNADGYILLIGTKAYGYDVLAIGSKGPTSDVRLQTLPPHSKLYVTLFTVVQGTWTRYTTSTFTTA